MNKTAAVFRLEDIPAEAQAKAKADRRISDLSAGQQTEANGRDVCAIVDGADVTIMPPTGHLISALKAIAAERVTKGI